LTQAGNAGIQKLIEKVKESYPDVPKAQIEAKIRELAVREKRQEDTVIFMLIFIFDIANAMAFPLSEINYCLG
jgi:hypothetical protein